jgi:hypothetical protein
LYYNELRVFMPFPRDFFKKVFTNSVHVLNCSRCEDFIDDWIEYGVSSWNPAQVINDLDGIKKKYGNKMALIGCWDSQGPAGWPTATEELIRSKVRETIDRFASGGGFMFWGSRYGAKNDKTFETKSAG